MWRGKYSRQSFMWQPFRGVASFTSGQKLNTAAFQGSNLQAWCTCGCLQGINKASLGRRCVRVEIRVVVRSEMGSGG